MCEQMRLARELERTRRLAKALARIDNKPVAIYVNPDGTYGFDLMCNLPDVKIKEIVTKY